MQYLKSTIALILTLVVLGAAPVAAGVVEDANMAVKAHQAGDLSLAFQLYTKLIESKELDSDDNLLVYAYNNRGQIHLQRGNQAMAFEDFNRALAAKPDPTAYYNRGYIYVERKENEKALADFDKALELNPKYSKAYTARGELLLRLGKTEQGRADLAKARAAQLKLEFQ